jgi:hypothetical protein
METWFAAFVQSKTALYWGGGIFNPHLKIEEQHCSESSCLYTETLLTFTFENEDGDNQTHYFRIKKPLVFIRKYDFDLLQSVASPYAGAHRH